MVLQHEACDILVSGVYMVACKSQQLEVVDETDYEYVELKGWCFVGMLSSMRRSEHTLNSM